MKDILGFEGRYAITLDGKVWSYPKHWVGNHGAKHGHDGMYLTPIIGKVGYRTVSLRKDNKYIGRYIHRLLAETYIPNPNNFECINHIDGDKLNNSLENLEWCTKAYNNRHAFKTGLVVTYKRTHTENCTCFRCKPEHRIQKGNIMAHVHGRADTPEEWLDSLLGRGPGDPDVFGYPGEKEASQLKADSQNKNTITLAPTSQTSTKPMNPKCTGVKKKL